MAEEIVIGSGLNLTALKDGDLAALDTMLAQYASIGCSHVEVTARRLDMICGGNITEARADAVAEILDRHPIRPVFHASHALNFMDLPKLEMHRSVAEASIELSRRMEMESIVIHSGRVPADIWLESREQLRLREREELKRLGDIAAKAGVKLAVENLIADPSGARTASGADPRALADQLAAVDHPGVGGCLDFGHAFLSAPVLDFDFVEAVAAFSELVWHLHLHDNCGIPDFRHCDDAGDRVAMGIGDLHMPMGWGRIPWRDLLPRMRFRKHTHAMIELQGRYRAVEESVVDTARSFSDYWNGAAALADALPGSILTEAAE